MVGSEAFPQLAVVFWLSPCSWRFDLKTLESQLGAHRHVSEIVLFRKYQENSFLSSTFGICYVTNISSRI